MNKIYAFLIIIPVIALLFFKALAFYEFDTKQRYIKNTIDTAAHKVMITGALTKGDKEELITNLNKLGDFAEENVILESGSINSNGSVSGLLPYTTGGILDRGEVFSIKVQSKNESLTSRIEGNSAVENGKLYYRAKAICRVEKKQTDE